MRGEDLDQEEEALGCRFVGQEFVALLASVRVADRQYPCLGHGETKCIRLLADLGDNRSPEFFRPGVVGRSGCRCRCHPKQLCNFLPQSSRQGGRMQTRWATCRGSLSLLRQQFLVDVVLTVQLLVALVGPQVQSSSAGIVRNN